MISIETHPSSAAKARRPRLKPTMSGTWPKTLLAITRSAGPWYSRTRAAVSGVRNAVSVGTPLSRAALPTLIDGSMPRQRIHKRTTSRKRYPSLLPTSTTNDPTVRSRRRTAAATNSAARMTREFEYDENDE